MAVDDESLERNFPVRGSRPTASPSNPGATIRRSWSSRADGQSFAEYGLIVALVVVVSVIAVVGLGGAIDTFVVNTITALIASSP